MRALAHKQNQPQERVSSSLARSQSVTSGSNHHTHPLLHWQRTIGNQAVQRLLQAEPDSPQAHDSTQDTPRFAQAKLMVNAPGDIYEQEADHISERVMHMPEPQLQRACPLHTKQVGSSDAGQTAAPPIVDEVLASSGQPLDLETRALMEPRFGRDFSQVRVHTDAKAAASSRALNAQAYTVGEHIVFAAGKYAHGTTSGKNLLTHELAHVAQQHNGHVALQRQPDDREVLTRDLKEISDEMKKIGEQAHQVAEDLEDLEIALWAGAMKGKQLPKAGAKLDKNTAFFVEAAIQNSQKLRPYLRGKLAITSLATNFKIYDFRSEFEARNQELSGNKGSTGPSIGQPTSQKLIYGFYHRKSDSIHLPPDATFGHAIHEGIHKYSSPAIEKGLGIYINEGFTQLFADRVADEHGLGSINHEYKDHLKCANIVLGWLSNNVDPLARAYFQGGTNKLVDEIVRRLGITGQRLVQLKADREGLGLCEEIKKKSP